MKHQRDPAMKIRITTRIRLTHRKTNSVIHFSSNASHNFILQQIKLRIYSDFVIRMRCRRLYGKMECRMDKIESQVLPVPPNMIASLRAGFDAVANQIVIIIIPIAIDLLLWLGPHLQVKTLVNNYLDSMAASAQINSIQAGDLISTSIDMMRMVAAHFNLLSLLRTIPVGIPSLEASRLPIEIPKGAPIFVDLANPLVAFCIAIGLLVTGLIAGSFYYNLVVQVSINGKIELKKVISNWMWSSIQILSLALALLTIFILISVPSSCVISAIGLIGIPLGQFAFFIYFGVILWLAFPLLFSAHGIFLNHNNALVSVRRSMVLTRMTITSTLLFFLLILAISEGLDLLWRVPPETSWLTLVGVGGHAFITSALLAASFIYYRDADIWTQQTLRLLKSTVEKAD